MLNNTQKAITRLLRDEPFFAHFFLDSRVLYDQYGIKTAGVCVLQGTTTFLFNTDFIKGCSAEQLVSIIKHEVLHVNLNHLDDMHINKEEDDLTILLNIAQDGCINQYIDGLPSGSVDIAFMEKLAGVKLEPFQTSKYYYDLMKLGIDKQMKGKKISRPGNSDDHNLDIPDKDASALAKVVVSAQARRALNKAAGNAPAAIVRELDAYGLSKINWKQSLRNFILSKVSKSTKMTIKKVNRRFSLPIPGKIKKRELEIGVCLDSSGSISDEDYNAFMNEVLQISKLVSKTHIIHADCVVQKVEEVKKGKKFKRTRHGSGGTAYQPAITKAKELGCDVIVYFGDFDCADTPTNPGKPFLWIGVGSSKPPADFGRIIRL